MEPGFPSDYWPLYASGPEKHMQALGVIAVNYNLFEGSLFPLFAHHITRAGMTDEECKYTFWNYDNAQRIGAIGFTFERRETEQSVKDCIVHLQRYWNECAEKRHILMHSRLDFLAPVEPLATVLGLDEQRTLSLAKRAKDDWAKVNHMQLSLRRLRAIADEIHCGYQFAIDIWSYLSWRDYPRGPFNLGPRTLPDKPRIRRKIKIRPPAEVLAFALLQPPPWERLPHRRGGLLDPFSLNPLPTEKPKEEGG